MSQDETHCPFTEIVAQQVLLGGGMGIVVPPMTAGELAAHALARLTSAGLGVSDFTIGQPSLDEVFLALTGSQAAPAPAEQAQSAPAGTEALR